MKIHVWPGLLALIVTLTAFAHVGGPGIFGDWKTPDGSVVRAYPCSTALCLKIVAISSEAPGTVDQNNPDRALRTRSLCNLEIGDQFVLSGQSSAAGGRLYDPLSGKTYKGSIDLAGDTLKLRGYVGIPLFGRTETWTRTGDTKPCS